MPASTTKIFLFVDGSNLYAGQYELFGPNKYLSFPNFISQVEKKLKIKFAKIYFYASYSPKPKRLTRKAKQYLKNEALFYQSVRKTKNTVFFKGYRSKTSGKEKEVDVKLAVDIVDFAHRGEYDSVYLFSGNADFTHALKVADNLSKRIYIIALENRVPHRFSFIYQTYIFSFLKFKEKILPVQKIKVVRLNRQEIIKTIRG